MCAGQVCRISIPDSGGASSRPVSFTDPVVTSVQVNADGVGPGAPCGGPAGCEILCCANPVCMAYGWTVAGSAQAPCGGTSCDLFFAPPADWAFASTTATLYSGYNYAGYIFSNSSARASCCGAAPPSPPPPTSAIATAAPSASFTFGSFAPSPSLSSMPAQSNGAGRAAGGACLALALALLGGALAL